MVQDGGQSTSHHMQVPDSGLEIEGKNKVQDSLKLPQDAYTLSW